MGCSCSTLKVVSDLEQTTETSHYIIQEQSPNREVIVIPIAEVKMKGDCPKQIINLDPTPIIHDVENKPTVTMTSIEQYKISGGIISKRD